jgi:hypothetical protein
MEYTSGGRLCCNLLFRMVKSCEVLKRESQTPVNVFSIYNAYIPTPPLGFLRKYAWQR